jgi:DNA polymerase-3 subunit epsilon
LKGKQGMREIVLDTETTGLDPKSGDRIVEIGAIELFNHMPTGKTFHEYLNPEKKMPQEAFAVHGLSDDFLKGKPLFRQIMENLTTFIGESKMIIHNAAFDMKFLNAELLKAGGRLYPLDQAIDTLMIARKKFPGAQNSLDALCRRFSIDNSVREKHGALLDSELSDVYLELIGGRQPDLILEPQPRDFNLSRIDKERGLQRKRDTQLNTLITKEEELAHNEFVETLGDYSIWKKHYC